MELKTLRYFVAILEAGSFSRAANHLYVAQPALTAQIKKLEAELDVPLFERTYAGVTPTSAGLQLYQDARRLLFDAQQMKERIERLPEGPEGSVTLAVPFLLASLLTGRVLTRVKSEYPRIRVFIIDDLSLHVRKAMLEKRADIGILVDDVGPASLKSSLLASEAMYLCGLDADGKARALITEQNKQPHILFSQAVSLPLVVQSRRFSIRSKIEELASQLGIEINVAHEQDSARVIRSLYLAGAGFTFTPGSALHDTIYDCTQRLVAKIIEPEILRHYYLVTPQSATLSPATLAVKSILLDEMAAMIHSKCWQADFLYRV